MTMKLILMIMAAFILTGCGSEKRDMNASAGAVNNVTVSFAEADTGKIVKTDEEWKKTLTPEQYYILRKKGTERAFTGKYDEFFEEGVYKCAGCGTELFSSDHKYDSGCGWPAYWSSLAGDRIIEKPDYSYGMERIEILCAKCGGHLGHVFDDGPQPTGQRYCVNSAALIFEKKKKK